MLHVLHTFQASKLADLHTFQPTSAPKVIPESEKGQCSYMNVLVSSGRAAVARSITETLNSDDEIIIHMKQERHEDKEI